MKERMEKKTRHTPFHIVASHLISFFFHVLVVFVFVAISFLDFYHWIYTRTKNMATDFSFFFLENCVRLSLCKRALDIFCVFVFILS